MQRFPATWNLVRHRRVNFTFDFTGRLFLVEFMSTEEHPRPHLSYDLSDFDSPTRRTSRMADSGPPAW